MKLVIASGLLPFVLLAQQTNTGKLLGTVTDDSGTAITGAIVSATLQPPGPVPKFTPVTVSSISGGKGAFELDNLPAGTFGLCVQKPDLQLLNPCLWSDTRVTAAVNSGQTTSGISLVVEKGVRISIRLADDQKLLKAASHEDILIGTGHGTSPFIPAQLSSKDDSGKTFSLLIPTGRAVQLSVFSAMFALGDEKGVAFGANNGKLSVLIPKGASPNSSSSGQADVTVHILGPGKGGH
jgi:hypothetical protein